MNEAEEELAARLSADLGRVLGVGVAIEVAIEIDGRASVRATILAESRIETIEVEAPTAAEAYPEVIRRAAALRLSGAWSRMITLT